MYIAFGDFQGHECNPLRYSHDDFICFVGLEFNLYEEQDFENKISSSELMRLKKKKKSDSPN